MRFTNFNAYRLAAEDLISDYSSFVKGQLQRLTDTSNGPKNVVELRLLRDQLTAFASRADESRRSNEFDLLAIEVQGDVTAIAEEAAKAVVDVDGVTDPDIAWPKMSRQQKEWATEPLLVDSRDVEKIRTRAEGRMREQSVPATDGISAALQPFIGRQQYSRIGPADPEAWRVRED